MSSRRQRQGWYVALAAALVLVAWPPRGVAAESFCAPGESPVFRGGLAALKAQLADWQGYPTTCEFPDPLGSGDILQRTSTGLGFWRSTTGGFGFTNGIDHWALTASGIVYWNGSSVDPPEDAVTAVPHPCIARHDCSQSPDPTAQPGEEPTPKPGPPYTYDTRNGPRTAEQIRDELLKAGYAGPWDLESMRAAYARAALLVVEPWPVGTIWPCVPDNTDCRSEPWWLHATTNQDTTRVSYSALGSHFVTERRFAEAINLLWQSPDGKALLGAAEQKGVQVITLDYDYQIAYATYVVPRKVVAVNHRFTMAPTWMVATVLAHELAHAADPTVTTPVAPLECLATETNAFSAARQFLVWLTRTLHPEGLPSIAVVSTSLSDEHTDLARQLYDVGMTTDLPGLVREAYKDTCGLE